MSSSCSFPSTSLQISFALFILLLFPLLFITTSTTTTSLSHFTKKRFTLCPRENTRDKKENYFSKFHFTEIVFTFFFFRSWIKKDAILSCWLINIDCIFQQNISILNNADITLLWILIKWKFNFFLLSIWELEASINFF